MLRRQALQEVVRPLVVMTPKSLLRLPAATSTIEELTSGGFQPVIDDAKVQDKSKVRRILLCSGKVFYDLEAARADAHDERVSIVRLEQFYPFPAAKIKEIIASYQNASEIFWVQEEPQNMGGWFFVQPRLMEIKGNLELRYAGRSASASPATGSYAIHELEHRKLVDEALIAKDATEISAASETEVSRNLAPASS
jgi:2-oxoglutarate dehydrogenase E1 component